MDGIVGVIPLIVLTVLAFVMMFGLGFIVNMLIKTTWLPIILYAGLLVFMFYYLWEPLSFAENIKGYSLGDVMAMIAGLLGAILSGYTIRTLRVKGYKMF